MNALEWIEHSFRHGIAYPVLRRVFRNRVCEAPVDLGGVRRMLVFRHDRIGDMIVTLPIFRALKRRAPKMELAVLASRANAELVQNCTFIDEVFTLETSWLRLYAQVMELRRRKFDVVINFVFNQTTIPAIRANIIAPDGLKIGQGPDKYGFYFNRLVKVPRFERHMTDQLAVFVENTFGIELAEEEVQHGIEVPVQQHNEVDAWLRESTLVRRSNRGSIGSPYVVFNVSAGVPGRELSEEQARAVCAVLSKNHMYRTVVIFGPQDKKAAEMIAARKEFKPCLVFRTEGTAPLLQLASLIGGAIAVVTPDTSVIHFASAMQTPVCGIYGEEYKEGEWRPFRVRHKIIRSEGERPTSSIPVAEITKGVGGFVEDILKERNR